MTKNAKLGTLIDRFEVANAEMAELNRKAREAKEKRDGLKEQVIEALEAVNMTGGDGNAITVAITQTDIPIIEDFDKFRTWLLRNKALECLQKRISAAAFMEHVDQRKGKLPPGTGLLPKKDLSVQKLRRGRR